MTTRSPTPASPGSGRSYTLASFSPGRSPPTLATPEPEPQATPPNPDAERFFVTQPTVFIFDGTGREWKFKNISLENEHEEVSATSQGIIITGARQGKRCRITFVWDGYQWEMT